MTNQNNNNNGNGREGVFYRGDRLLGWGKFTPERMLEIFTGYEDLIKRGRSREAREMEARIGAPETWRNYVEARLMERKVIYKKRQGELR